MPAELSPSSAEVALLLDLPADIRVAIGRPATGLDGFRRTHVDALTTQRMLSRLVSSWPVARYDDIQLVALMTTDPNRAVSSWRTSWGISLVPRGSHEALPGS